MSDTNLLQPSPKKPAIERTKADLCEYELKTTLECEIEVVIGHSKISSDSDFTKVERNLLCDDTVLVQTLYEKLEIHDHSLDTGNCAVDFMLQELCRKSEPNHQLHVSSLTETPNNHLLDTHALSDPATCAAPMLGHEIHFNAKPDATSKVAPMFLEIKSRYDADI